MRWNYRTLTKVTDQGDLYIGRLGHVKVNQHVRLARYIWLANQDVKLEAVTLYYLVNHILHLIIYNTRYFFSSSSKPRASW